jgi:short-subunit dehydrogenase
MGKVLVLTGGTKGIGRAVNMKFASQGFDIITCSRSSENLDLLKQEIIHQFPECGIYCIPADLSQRTGVDKFFNYVRSIQTPVDVLVNNAGIFLPGQVYREPEGNLEYLMNLNVYSAYHLIRGIVKEMISRNAGHIFNLCSVASISAYPDGGSYGISKFALYGLTKALRQELKEFNIRVTAVIPGATLTDSWKGTGLPPERFMNPEDVAESIFSAWKLKGSSVVEEIIIRPQLGDI